MLFYAHATFAFLLFLFELCLGFWLVIKAKKDVIDVALLAGQTSGFLITVLSLSEVGVLHLLVVGQLIAMWTFAFLLTHAVYRIEQIDTKQAASL